MKFRKKPVVIEATRWFKNGDHPQDDCWRLFEDTGEMPRKPREGKVVRYYRTPSMDGQTKCKHCGDIMHNHGWIDTLEGGHTVCPGDWIITGVKGEYIMPENKCEKCDICNNRGRNHGICVYCHNGFMFSPMEAEEGKPRQPETEKRVFEGEAIKQLPSG